MDGVEAKSLKNFYVCYLSEISGAKITHRTYGPKYHVAKITRRMSFCPKSLRSDLSFILRQKNLPVCAVCMVHGKIQIDPRLSTYVFTQGRVQFESFNENDAALMCYVL